MAARGGEPSPVPSTTGSGQFGEGEEGAAPVEEVVYEENENEGAMPTSETMPDDQLGEVEEEEEEAQEGEVEGGEEEEQQQPHHHHTHEEAHDHDEEEEEGEQS